MKCISKKQDQNEPEEIGFIHVKIQFDSGDVPFVSSVKFDIPGAPCDGQRLFDAISDGLNEYSELGPIRSGNWPKYGNVYMEVIFYDEEYLEAEVHSVKIDIPGVSPDDERLGDVFFSMKRFFDDREDRHDRHVERSDEKRLPLPPTSATTAAHGDAAPKDVARNAPQIIVFDPLRDRLYLEGHELRIEFGATRVASSLN